jgi:hypothetical protein
MSYMDEETAGILRDVVLTLTMVIQSLRSLEAAVSGLVDQQAPVARRPSLRLVTRSEVL